MEEDTLYERLKDCRIKDLSADLLNQIELKGSTHHNIIGSHKRSLAIIVYPETSSLNSNLQNDITYADLKKEYPKDYKIFLKIITDCIEDGFKV